MLVSLNGLTFKLIWPCHNQDAFFSESLRGLRLHQEEGFQSPVSGNIRPLFHFSGWYLRLKTRGCHLDSTHLHIYTHAYLPHLHPHKHICTQQEKSDGHGDAHWIKELVSSPRPEFSPWIMHGRSKLAPASCPLTTYMPWHTHVHMQTQYDVKET